MRTAERTAFRKTRFLRKYTVVCPFYPCFLGIFLPEWKNRLNLGLNYKHEIDSINKNGMISNDHVHY